MPSAKWHGQIIASSEQFETVESNIYFPRNALRDTFFTESQHTTVCPWKGTAAYFDITVDGKTNQNAAWYYPNPKEAAANIKDYVAFWKGVEIVK